MQDSPSLRRRPESRKRFQRCLDSGVRRNDERACRVILVHRRNLDVQLFGAYSFAGVVALCIRRPPCYCNGEGLAAKYDPRSDDIHRHSKSVEWRGNLAFLEMAITGVLVWGLPAIFWSPKPLNVAILGAVVYGLIGAFQKQKLGISSRIKGAIAIGLCGAALAFIVQAIFLFTRSPLIQTTIYGAYLFSIAGATWPVGEWESLKKLFKHENQEATKKELTREGVCPHCGGPTLIRTH
jgi:hypothetical protein